MTERERDRKAARRLAIIRHAQEVTGNVAKTCRYYGITRQSYYTWLRRYEEGGLEALRDRSQRPHVSSNATKAEVVGKIVYLRRTYHFGLAKIAISWAAPAAPRSPPDRRWRAGARTPTPPPAAPPARYRSTGSLGPDRT